jgi:hypothetical protein
MRSAIATRSMNETLYAASGELLPRRQGASPETEIPRFRLTGTDSLGYFRQLAGLGADWVLNVDEDAFVLSPRRLLDLVAAMERGGYAACGMPDGGVVGIRRHNPVVCNAFFNVFDLRRVRPVWNDWAGVSAAGHQSEYEGQVAPFARRSAYAFDHFERYYGAFFSLLQAGERILYLDAEEWEDGVSTLLKDPDGKPLLIHCWYSRHFEFSYHTRRRYARAVDAARRTQGLAPYTWPSIKSRPVPETIGSNVASRWDSIYRETPGRPSPPDTLTYEKASAFLQGCATVEDWGCGWGWFRTHLNGSARYRGVDGACSPYADEVADLCGYTSQAEGLLLRHVLEHNPAWDRILSNALRSFTKRMVIVLFTPFADVTQVIGYSETLGVPDLAFAKTDLIRRFTGLQWQLEENLQTDTQYGIEQVFYLERVGAAPNSRGGQIPKS